MTTIIINFVSNTVASLGYGGVFGLMTLQSSGFPIPSEVIMGFSGFLVGSGKFIFLPTVIFGTMGSISGAAISYWIGRLGGRPLVLRFGKYLLFSPKDLASTETFFQKYGQISVFLGKCLPVLNTFIGFPAGIARLSFWRFLIFAGLGSLLWNFSLVYFGKILGANWIKLEEQFHYLGLVVGLLIVAGVAFWIWRHLRQKI